MVEATLITRLARAPAVEVFPQISPYLVEVLVPLSTGTVDEAVRQAQFIMHAMIDSAIAPLLAGTPAELDTFLEAYNGFMQARVPPPLWLPW